MDRTLALMLVFFGGGLGCLIRYATTPDPSNPFMVANIVACLVIGVLYALTRHKVLTNIYIQSFVTVGFLGGLSTFTPLATYAIVQAEPMFIKSFLLFIGYLVVFFVISLVGYIPAALYCQKVMGMQPVPSIIAVVRSHKRNRLSKRRKEQEQEQRAKQYGDMLKELSLAKEMLSKLQEQTATLGQLAKRSPQAAREYAKAKSKIAELQRTLQIQQARIMQLNPLKGQAPSDLQAAPGYMDAEHSDLERQQAWEAAREISKSKVAEEEAGKVEKSSEPEAEPTRAEQKVTFFEAVAEEEAVQEKSDAPQTQQAESETKPEPKVTPAPAKKNRSKRKRK